jgi:RNA polymerase sigma-70 factor (ECF subfamily)
MRTQEFERLYEHHAQQLYAFLAYRTGDPVLAEDLVADTFERVLAARHPFDGHKASEKTWLYAIALNRLRDVVRREVVEQRAMGQVASDLSASDGPNGHGGGFDAAETRQVVMAALRTLGDEEREAVSLRFGGDLSLAEIAAVLDVPRSTVEGRVYRGLKHLRDRLEARSAPGAAVS